MRYSIKEFEQIYMRAFGPSMRLAASMLHDADEARDVVQEAFIKLWESDADVASPEGMVIRSVRNACLNRLEHMEVRERYRRRCPIDADMASHIADADESAEQVQAALSSLLTERERQVVEKIYDEGMTYKEAASSLNVSVALVNKCIVKALKTLRKHFNTHKL